MLGGSGFPLGWMLGPAFAGLALTLWGHEVKSDGRYGDIGRAILGAAIGGGVTMAHWVWLIGKPQLVALVLVSTALCSALGYAWLRRCCRWGQGTAYFSSLPGGLSEMVELARSSGVDAGPVALAHTLRVFFLVAGSSAVIAYLEQVNLTQMSFGRVGVHEVILLLICVPLGLWLGKRLRLPAPSVLGPLLLAAFLSATADLSARPPQIGIILAQFFIGWSLAARFRGIDRSSLPRLIVQVAGQLALIVPVWWMAALLGSVWLGINTETAVLGLAPGGQAEMALLALLVGVSAVWVVMMHLLRVLIIVGTAGWLFRRLGLENSLSRR